MQHHHRHHRRMDVIYFSVAILVAGLALLATQLRPERPSMPISPLAFKPPPLFLPEPIVELPEPRFAIRRGAARQAPDGWSAGFFDRMERALSRVRVELLESAESRGLSEGQPREGLADLRIAAPESVAAR